MGLYNTSNNNNNDNSDPYRNKRIEKKKRKTKQRKSTTKVNFQQVEELLLPSSSNVISTSIEINTNKNTVHKRNKSNTDFDYVTPSKKTRSNNDDSIVQDSNVNTDKKFVTSSDGKLYEHLMKTDYQGLAHIPACKHSFNGVHSEQFYKRTRIALENLYDYYHYDIVMAGGKHLSRTFVKRCLVGEPGITYKYLGLRLFAHAWSGLGCTQLFAPMNQLNQVMIQLTKQQQLILRNEKEKKIQKKKTNTNDDTANSNYLDGDCNYNLTLINYMEPSMLIQDLKEDNVYGMGKVSVSWHADSSLQANTCIGVYHTLPRTSKTRTSSAPSSWDWKIALRKNPPESSSERNSSNSNNKSTVGVSEGQPHGPPPIVVDTQPGDSYFLLNEMNETHQHMVLTGSACTRISSTHRVAVIESDTFEYISGRIKLARKLYKNEVGISTAAAATKTTPNRNKDNNNKNKAGSRSMVDSKRAIAPTKRLPSQWRSDKVLLLQDVLTEVEFEWIEQYWIQGMKHDQQHLWWQGAIRSLEDAWVSLEQYTYELFHRCCYGSSTNRSTNNNIKNNTNKSVNIKQLVPISIIQGLLDRFKDRMELRTKWDTRRYDKIYKRRISAEYQPVVGRPVFPASTVTLKATQPSPSPLPSPQQQQQMGRLPRDLTEAIVTLTKIVQTRTATSQISIGTCSSATNTEGKACIHNASRSSDERNDNNNARKPKDNTASNVTTSHNAITTQLHRSPSQSPSSIQSRKTKRRLLSSSSSSSSSSLEQTIPGGHSKKKGKTMAATTTLTSIKREDRQLHLNQQKQRK